MIREYLATTLPRIWQNVHHPASVLLYPVSLFYGLIMRVRRWMFGTGLMKSVRLNVPVIVVGNVTVGGTGKSPLVIWLAVFLAGKGYRPGIVSRGYGGSSPEWPVDVTAAETVEQVGDEAVMLRHRTGVPVAVSPIRKDAASLLIDNHDVNVIISDDGLQHLALERDLEVVVIDAKRQFGNGRLLPAGPLREPLSSISGNAITVYSTTSPNTDYEYSMYPVPSRFVNIADPGKESGTSSFSGQAVHALAGIGVPEKFFTTLGSLGIRPVRHAFADHHVFTREQVQFNDDLPVIMTEKDAVKCAGIADSNCWYLEINVQPTPAFVDRLEMELQTLNH